MTRQEKFLELLPPELRKGTNFIKLSNALGNFFDWYSNEIKTGSNYTVIDDLTGSKLDKYGARWGATRVENWTDSDVRKRIRLLWYTYDKDLGFLDNLSLQFTKASGYFSQVQFSTTGISGEIDCSLLVPEGETQTPFSDIQDFWIAGCKVYPTILTESLWKMFDSFGVVSENTDKYLTGIDPLAPTFKEL